MIALFLFACEKIVLKKSAPLPYKLAEGRYLFNIYELEYPEDIAKKEEFIKSLEQSALELIKRGQKAMFLFNQQFIEDYIYIKKSGTLPEESFLSKPASQLNEQELEYLKSVSGVEAKTKQDILNLQIRVLSSILNNPNFDDTKLYTELNKEKLLQDFFKIRRRIVEIFEKGFLKMIIRLDSVYRQEEKEEIVYPYFTKKTKPLRNIKFSNLFDQYKEIASLVVDDLEESDFEGVVNGEIRLPLKEFFVTSDKYKGFLFKNASIIYVIGGKRYVSSNSEYHIEFNVKKIDVSDTKDIDDKYVLEDLYKDSETLEKEKSALLKAIESLKDDAKRDEELKKDMEKELKEEERDGE